jgi:ferredoxin
MPPSQPGSPGEVKVRLRDGEVRTIPAVEGDSLMEAIRNAGIDELMAMCGGCCSCGTCHVYVEGGRHTELPPISDDENAILDYSDFREPNSRLSCQLRFEPSLVGIELTIAPED